MNYDYQTQLSMDGTFSIDSIVGGKYQLLAFLDRNNNKNLDTGLLNDDSESEKFYVYPDSLELRANWEFEIENWEIN